VPHPGPTSGKGSLIRLLASTPGNWVRLKRVTCRADCPVGNSASPRRAISICSAFACFLLRAEPVQLQFDDAFDSAPRHPLNISLN
jgi:hypothetical protein